MLGRVPDSVPERRAPPYRGLFCWDLLGSHNRCLGKRSFSETVERGAEIPFFLALSVLKNRIIYL